MLKILKYLLLARVYKKTKKNLLFLLLCFIALALISLIVNDAMSVASGFNVAVLLMIKWFSVIVLLGFMVLNILKIINIASSPFAIKDKIIDERKDKIMSKENIFSVSDLIIQKYKKAK